MVTVSDVVDVVCWFLKHWEEFRHTFLNVAGKEFVSRVRIADEINRLHNGRLNYSISILGDEFFSNRPRFTQMRSLYLNEYDILSDTTFTEKIARELKEIKL